MIKGYAVNHNAVSEQKYEDLKRALGLLENVFGQNLIMAEQQAKELFAVVKDYTYSLDTLDAYDYQSLEISDTTLHEKFRATYENAMEEQFEKEIHSLAQQIKGLHDQAVAVYTPLVDDICARIAPMKEVEWLLDYMFGFAGEERMLLLYKRVCRHYWQVYPEMIAWHIMEYRKEYDPESLPGYKGEDVQDE